MHAALGVLLWILLARVLIQPTALGKTLQWPIQHGPLAFKLQPSPNTIHPRPLHKGSLVFNPDPYLKTLAYKVYSSHLNKGPSTLACTRVLHGQPRSTPKTLSIKSTFNKWFLFNGEKCYNTYPYKGAPLRWSAFERLDKDKDTNWYFLTLTPHSSPLWTSFSWLMPLQNCQHSNN